MKFTAKGPGLESVRKALQDAASKDVRVGVLGAQAEAVRSDVDMTNAELVAIHEFGAPRAGIPERAPIRTSFDQHERAWQALAARLLQGIISGKLSTEQALGILGEQAVADMRATVRAGLEPPLKPETIRRKGSSTPLIGSGRIVQSFAWEIVDR